MAQQAVELEVRPRERDTALPAVRSSAMPTFSARLIDQARRGDRAALSSLLGELQDPWYRMSLAMLRNPDLATDAVQETGLRFLKQIQGFRGDSQLRTWSLGIAINVVREMKRRQVKSQTGAQDFDLVATGLADAAALNSAHARTETDERKNALRAVLGDLPDRQREAIVLRFFEDLSVDETAKIMNCAEGTVKATVHQALRSLKKRLQNWA